MLYHTDELFLKFVGWTIDKTTIFHFIHGH